MHWLNKPSNQSYGSSNSARLLNESVRARSTANSNRVLTERFDSFTLLQQSIRYLRVHQIQHRNLKNENIEIFYLKCIKSKLFMRRIQIFNLNVYLFTVSRQIPKSWDLSLLVMDCSIGPLKLYVGFRLYESKWSFKTFIN